MYETKILSKVEGANLLQFLIELTGRIKTCQEKLLDLEPEYENTQEFEKLFLMIDNLLKKIDEIEASDLTNLTKEILIKINNEAEDVFAEFEKKYGNKTVKITTKPN